MNIKIQILALMILLATGHGMDAAWMGRDDLLDDEIILDSCRVDFPDEFGNTPLENAMFFKNDIQKVKQLIASGANVNTQNNWMQAPPLYNAIKNDQNKMIPLLLAAGADVNQQNRFGSTSLHAALYDFRPVNIIQLLVDAGADVNQQNNFGNTPLHIAAQFNTGEAIQALLAVGSEINKQNDCGDTPLHLAYHLYSHSEITQFLIAAGADQTIRNNKGKTAAFID